MADHLKERALSVVARCGDASIKMVAEKMNLPHSEAARLLRELLGEGKLVRTRDGYRLDDIDRMVLAYRRLASGMSTRVPVEDVRRWVQHWNGPWPPRNP